MLTFAMVSLCSSAQLQRLVEVDSGFDRRGREKGLCVLELVLSGFESVIISIRLKK